MKIIITGRHFNVSEQLNGYIEKKFKKLEKYFHRLIDINVTMYLEKHNNVAEAVINADHSRFHGIEKATDMYASIDQLVKSMESQAHKHKEKVSDHKGGGVEETIEAPAAGSEEAPYLYSSVDDKPMDEIEAFLVMKVDKRPYIIFKKCDSKNYKKDKYEDSCAVIYRLEDDFRMAEIPIAGKKNKKKDNKKLKEFELVILNDSITKPKIKFKKSSNKLIKRMSIDNAASELMSCKEDYFPFLNSDTNNLNIICKQGDRVEIISPRT